VKIFKTLTEVYDYHEDSPHSLEECENNKLLWQFAQSHPNDKIKRAVEVLKKNITLVKMMPALCISQDIQEAIMLLEEK
jgi:hypothetical protein